MQVQCSTLLIPWYQIVNAFLDEGGGQSRTSIPFYRPQGHNVDSSGVTQGVIDQQLPTIGI